jgi:catechol 2,3-dioxygenase-like lactoylglutathione lyase family enzyme
MKLAGGHAKRLFVGFTCSIMFLVVFALLVAHNTEAESSNNPQTLAGENALKIAIPTARPEETIAFYKKLGFKATPRWDGNLDVVSMERGGSPYTLEICHNKYSEAGTVVGGVSSLSFPVRDISREIAKLRARGIDFSEIPQTGADCASLSDPNGIKIRLFERD